MSPTTNNNTNNNTNTMTTATRTANRKMTRCMLCVDMSQRAVWIRITGTLGDCIGRIEDVGLEVVEEQTKDYEGDPPSEWTGTILLRELKETDYLPWI